MSGKPYCYECGTLREYCDCDIYDALAEDDLILDENLAASAIEAGTAETVEQGSVHESAAPQEDARSPWENPHG